MTHVNISCAFGQKALKLSEAHLLRCTMHVLLNSKLNYLKLSEAHLLRCTMHVLLNSKLMSFRSVAN